MPSSASDASTTLKPASRSRQPHRLPGLGLEQGLDRGRHGRAKLVVPAVGTDRVCVGPLKAGILDLVCEAEHRRDTGKRGRLRVRQLPTNRVDLISHSPGTIRRFPGLNRTVAIFVLSLILGIDDFAMGNLGSPVCGDQREGRIDRGGHGSYGEGADTGNAGAGGNGEETSPCLVDGWGLIHGTSLERLPRILGPPGVAGEGGPFRPLLLGEAVPPGDAQFVVGGHRLDGK